MVIEPPKSLWKGDPSGVRSRTFPVSQPAGVPPTTRLPFGLAKIPRGYPVDVLVLVNVTPSRAGVELLKNSPTVKESKLTLSEVVPVVAVLNAFGSV